jgi:hypothetical protein
MIKLKQLLLRERYSGFDGEPDTPRTNADAGDGWSGDAVCVSAGFCQEIERELNLSKKRGDALAEAARRVVLTGEADDIHNLSLALDEYQKK